MDLHHSSRHPSCVDVIEQFSFEVAEKFSLMRKTTSTKQSENSFDTGAVSFTLGNCFLAVELILYTPYGTVKRPLLGTGLAIIKIVPGETGRDTRRDLALDTSPLEKDAIGFDRSVL